MCGCPAALWSSWDIIPSLHPRASCSLPTHMGCQFPLGVLAASASSVPRAACPQEQSLVPASHGLNRGRRHSTCPAGSRDEDLDTWALSGLLSKVSAGGAHTLNLQQFPNYHLCVAQWIRDVHVAMGRESPPCPHCRRDMPDGRPPSSTRPLPFGASQCCTQHLQTAPAR